MEKTPGDRIDDKKAISRVKDSKAITKKRDWEGGPGMLSRAELTKKRSSNFHKAQEIT